MSKNASNETGGLSPEAQTSFFNQTYYLFLILFVLHFFFSVYLFYKIKGIEKNGGTAAAQVVDNGNAPAPAPVNLSVAKPSKDEPWRGPENARFILIEYSDLECPFCKTVHPDLQRLVDENDNVAWIFRHYPLSFHPKAQKFAESVECAADQAGFLGGNKNENFWKLTDAIFEQQDTLQPSGVPALAATLGLDQGQLQECMDSGRMAETVKADLDEGTAAGVAATPTTVIFDTETGESRTIEGALPYESIKAELDSLMAQ